MWGENFIPELSSFIDDEDDNMIIFKPYIDEFLHQFGKLVKKYPFLETGSDESCHMWLVIMKMYKTENWEYFDGNPIHFINEVDKRIERLFPNL